MVVAEDRLSPHRYYLFIPFGFMRLLKDSSKVSSSSSSSSSSS